MVYEWSQTASYRIIIPARAEDGGETAAPIVDELELLEFPASFQLGNEISAILSYGKEVEDSKENSYYVTVGGIYRKRNAKYNVIIRLQKAGSVNAVVAKSTS
jgi:hypothetical protein